MKRVRISDLKSHLSKYLRAAEAGTVIEVLDRARPIARIIPIVIDHEDEFEIERASVPFRSVRAIRLPRVPVDALALLRDERGER